MVLSEVSKKKLEALGRKIKKRLQEEGYRGKDFTIETTAISPIELDVKVYVNYFVEEQRFFDMQENDVSQIIEQTADPLSMKIGDEAYFGGGGRSLIQRGKMIDGALLLSTIHWVAKFPSNRFK